MALRFKCPCGQKLKTSDDLLGKRARCPKCNKLLRVPPSDSYETTAGALDENDIPKLNAKLRSEVTPGNSKGRVVIADSCQDDLDRMETVLLEHGYEAFPATDGPQAVEQIRATQPDAVILDVKLDVLSGFQVIDHITNPENPKNEAVWMTPIIMTCELLKGRDKQYAMSKGVKAYFVKPIAAAQLCARLEKEIHRQTGYQTSLPEL